MITDNLQDVIAAAIGADTSTWAGMLIGLADEAFVPTPQLELGDITEASFTGYARVTMNGNVLNVSKDPLTGDNILTVVPPVGGWYWEVTGGTGLPKTIYGWFLLSDDTVTLFGSDLLEEPVTLTASGQSVALGQIKLRLPVGNPQLEATPG